MKHSDSNYDDILNLEKFDNSCITNVKLFLELLDEKIKNFDLATSKKLEKLVKTKYLNDQDLTIISDLEKLMIIITPLNKPQPSSNNIIYHHAPRPPASVTSIIYHYVHHYSQTFYKYKNFIINHSKFEKKFWDGLSVPELCGPESNKKFFETAKSIINRIKLEREKFANLLKQSPSELYKLIITKTIIDQVSYEHENLLMLSVTNKDEQSFKKLLFDYGANIYIEGYRTIFHYLLVFHPNKTLPYFNIAKKLLNRELLDFKDDEGQTIFDIALSKNQKEIVSILVTRGTKVPMKLINQVKSFIEYSLIPITLNKMS